MVMRDLLQYKKKLKNPYIRRWYHGKGDDTYRQMKASKRILHSAKGLKGDYVVAYKGKEYGVNEFIKKHPKYGLKKSIRKVRRRSR